MADVSPRTDTSTDVDTDDKDKRVIFFAPLFFSQGYGKIIHFNYSAFETFFTALCPSTTKQNAISSDAYVLCI